MSSAPGYVPGPYNIGIGTDALSSSGFTGESNVAIGYAAAKENTTSSHNVAIGFESLRNNSTGLYNTSVGSGALRHGNSITVQSGGSQMTALGYGAGRYRGTGTSSLVTGTGGIYIGYQARGSTNGQTNEIVIGVDALGLGSNTAVIGATLQSAATIYGVLNLPSGLSAAGATFSGNVSAQSTLYTDNIQAIGNQINIANAASGRIAFGDFDGAGNSTFVFIRDGTSSLLISNPYGDIAIGDSNGVDSGNYITYNAASAYLDGGGNSSLTNFSSGSFGALLTASAGISAAGTTAATFNGLVDMNFNTLYEPTLRYYNEVLASPAITANVLTLDLSTAQMFTVSLNANITTFTISNTPVTANRSIGFTLIFTADGTARTVTWGAAVKWANNDPPALTSTNAKKDILSFVSPDGGTTWYGFIGGLNF